MDRPVGAGRIMTFYSYKGGVGRTMALANIAWLLASNGRRVLTVDWDLESPGLHLYFMPFLADRKLRQSPGVIDAIMEYARAVAAHGPLNEDELHRLARIQRYATSLERYEFPHGGSIDFVPSGQQVAEYSATVSNFDWSDFWSRLDGRQFLRAWAADMRANYDITLIDSRTGLSDNAGICTVELPDTVVNCFTFNNQNIDGAAAAARAIRAMRDEQGQPIRIFPVPTRVEDGETAKLDRWRGNAQNRFSALVADLGHTDPAKYWGTVEIPYKVFYAYEETLATFGDRPHLENTLLAAYQRLAGELIGEPCDFEGPTDAVRRGWLAEFEQHGPINPGVLVVGYTPRDRVWAEWISYQLRTVGQRSTLQDVHAEGAVASLARADRALLLLSQESVRLPQAQEFWEAAQARDTSSFGRFLVPVRLDGFRLPHPFDAREPVDMFNVSDQHARDSLLAQLELRDAVPIGESSLGSGPRPRFPFEPARVWRAPSRNAAFTGRDTILEELRERLNASTALTGPAVLQGIGGVGKTQIVMEYLHRFAADYDIVWWISADQPALIPTALADLAGPLELPVAGSVEEQVPAVLEALRMGRPSPRWALVFDNTEDPEQLRPYVPSGAGDVIVTTRGGEWSRQAWTIDINVFPRAESVELLTRRVPGVDPVDAHAIAEKLGDLPLAVEQAATWLAATAMSANSYLEMLDEHLPQFLDSPPTPDYPHPAAQIWRLSQQRLRVSNPAAAHLVELCAFFAHDPIPTSLLSSPGMVAALGKDDPRLQDPLLYGSLVREITRYGLARQDSFIQALRMHRLVQNVIRNDLTPDVARERQRQVHAILAAERRGDPDDISSFPAYQRLLPHLEPTGALNSDDRAVHRLVIDMVRALRSRGDLASSQDLATRVIENWATRYGPDEPSVLRVRAELADTLRAQGADRQAFDVDIDVRERMARVFGEMHLYTLMAGRGLAGDLRGLGRYQEARELDEQTLVKFQATMGGDHAETLKAANNLAVSRRLTGDPNGALEITEDVLERRRRVLGPEDGYTLHSGIMHGRDLRETGDLARSRETLETLVEMCSRLDDRHPRTLLARRNLAVTLRQLGLIKLASDAGNGLRESFERAVGPRHPHTLAATLEEACLLSAEGDHTGAEELAQEVLERYRSTKGADHPFTLAAANNLAIFRMRAGRYPDARPLIDETAQRFADALTEDHPHTLLCASNRANALFAMGEPAAAGAIDERSYLRLRALLGSGSPAVIGMAANLVTSRAAAGDHAAADQLRTDTLRFCLARLGGDHPYARALRDGRRIETDVEPAET
ncbi:FxSxx-COOH system tetratricopeptide repeat protein [Micromonospora sp. NBC_01813]|uniref:FxSxx-COOH system tetratricopeptide repeat protein n=1 Tax=Micromonospora sp. NBC_01813 TaxID=2975988 RepID=UPI002DDAB730|nr:FxSxx-COOH system tetratricopeptide repeat protein [Micromonospora sp. NBC_01813]WSA06872.1 FxSxx-COOH system tetratricopeptide repeat protein [Micromonospora sp. NBC_01813]